MIDQQLKEAIEIAEEELKELGIKHDTLYLFLTLGRKLEGVENISEEELNIIHNQLGAMATYYIYLKKRIELMKKRLEGDK